MSLQSSQERQFDDFALVWWFDHTRFRAVLRQKPMQAVTMIIAHIVGGNRERPARMAEQLFWRVLEHLKEQTPGFAAGKWRGPAFRFKMPIHVMDSTTMELVANCLDWAKHRRRKAAAKTHLRLNLQSLLPSFVIVDTAAEHDNKRARELCADLKSGEIALFDKGYVDFGHLRDLDERGVFWVTRAKENMVYEVVRKMPVSKDPKILRDEVIVLSHENKPAPELMRRVVALVQIDGEEREMVFLTNNLEWSPRSVADLYRCRWQIEVFFKQIKRKRYGGCLLCRRPGARVEWRG